MGNELAQALISSWVDLGLLAGFLGGAAGALLVSSAGWLFGLARFIPVTRRQRAMRAFSRSSEGQRLRHAVKTAQRAYMAALWASSK